MLNVITNSCKELFEHVWLNYKDVHNTIQGPKEVSIVPNIVFSSAGHYQTYNKEQEPV